MVPTTSAIAGKNFPLWYVIFLGVVVFGASALFGLFYGLFMGFLLTVRGFGADMAHLVKDGVNRVKNSIEARAGAGLSGAADAAEIITHVFSDLGRNIRQYAAHTAAGFLTFAIISGALFIAKNIIMRGIKKIKNKADFFTMLSARASLILAIVLNLKLFAKIALCFGALLGIAAAMAQIIIVYLVR